MPTINLGQIAAIKSGTTPPTNTIMIWYDTNVGQNIHKYYDTTSSTWKPLSEVGGKSFVDFSQSVANEYVSTPPYSFTSYELGRKLSCRFDTDNTGSVLVDISTIGQKEIKKNNGSGVLVSLESGDIQSGIMYIIHYDGTDFQIMHINEIDGLADILANLVPPPAPSLSDYTLFFPATPSGTTSDGKLSFDDSKPIAGQNYIGANNSPTPVLADELWTSGGKRLPITKSSNGKLSGVLNEQVPVDIQVPTPAYPANSFGDADRGTLKLFINGTETDSIDLTVLTAQDTTAAGTATGISVSAATDSKFSNGASFTNYKNRTGTWIISDSDVNLVQGYNYAYVQHSFGTTVINLDRFEWIIDDNTTASVITNETLDTLVMLGSRKLSGVDFHTSGSAKGGITIDNQYRNTYIADNTAISIGAGNLQTVGLSLASSLGVELKQSVFSGITLNIASLSLVNESIVSSVVVERTVQPSVTGVGASITGILLDNNPSSSTAVVENFDDEDYRLPDNFNFESFATMVTGLWDSENSIKDSDAIAGYDGGMQVIKGGLVYPSLDFRTTAIINGSIWNNGGTKGAARDYSANASKKTYYRFFKQTTPTTGNFQITLNGSAGINLVNLDVATDINTMSVELKLPSQTGFMDCYKDFVGGNWANQAGCRDLGTGSGGINNTLGLTVGTKSTANSGGIVVIKLQVADNFAHILDSINFTFL